MKEPVKTIRDTDDEARRLARRLVRGSRHAGLAVIEPDTGYPFCSRVLTGTAADGVPVVLVSGLSTHTAAIHAEPRVSLLFGETGKGDPLAHPRITVRCMAQGVERESPEHRQIRARFIARHPKAALYADFPDFSFFRMVPQSASLNGGFGRAYVIDGSDLLIASPAIADLADLEPDAIQHMNRDHAEAADTIARGLGKSKSPGWSICGIDAAGMDLARGDEILRIEFDQILADASQLKNALASVLVKSRRT